MSHMSLNIDAIPAKDALSTRAQLRDSGIALAESARRELLLFAPGLDPDLYDQAPFLAAVRRLALARPDYPVRVLLDDARRIARNGHRLIELARQLSSRIALREIDERDQDRTDAFLIVDTRGYLHRPLVQANRAVLAPDARRMARLLREEFVQMWEVAHESSELRRLYL